MSPSTGELLESRRLHPNHGLRKRCADWVERHSTEDGFRSRLRSMAGALVTTSDPNEALVQLRAMNKLVSTAGKMRSLLLAPAGLQRLHGKMDSEVVSNTSVVSALANLEKRLSCLADTFKERLFTLQRLQRASSEAVGVTNLGEGASLAQRLSERDAMALALQDALSLAEHKRDMAKVSARAWLL